MEKIKVIIEINPAGWGINWANKDQSRSELAKLSHDIKSAICEHCGIGYDAIESVQSEQINK